MVSFDETRLDDTTHGAGGCRKARTERITRCGTWDDGEVAGKKSASHTMSLLGGSNGLHEPVPPFVSLARSEFPKGGPLIFKLGPIATVNGKQLGTQGTCNEKGSIDGQGIILALNDCVIPMFDAYDGLTAQKMGMLVCDGCGTHMTLELLEHCTDNHIIVIIRTPYCSSIIQFEDIVNFWDLKNCKDIGWCLMAFEPCCPPMSFVTCSVCMFLYQQVQAEDGTDQRCPRPYTWKCLHP